MSFAASASRRGSVYDQAAYWLTVVAVYFLVTGITGLQYLGYAGWPEQVFYGSSLVIAVTLSHLAGRRRLSGVV